MRIKIISLFLAILTVASLSACTKNTADENKVTDAVTEAVTNNSMKPTSGTFGSFDYITDESGNAAITKYSGKDKTVKIPAAIENFQVKEISPRAFYENEALEAVEIPDSITVIGSEAFSGCTKLADVKLSKNLKAVEGRAFYKTPFLANTTDEFYTVGDGVLLKYNGSDSAVTIPDGIKFISSAFESNTKLLRVTLPSTVEKIGSYAFISCMALKEITIPTSVTSIGECAFAKCGSLTDITLPDSVERMGNMCFLYCTNLQKIQLPLNLTVIPSSAFQSCTSLTSVVIPNNVKTIENQAFLRCSALTSVTIPENATQFGSIIFANCSENLVIKCKEGSAAEKYCVENELTVEKQ